MATIGARSIVYSSSFLIPDEESVEATFTFENWNARLILSFHPARGSERNIESAVEGDGLHLRFNRWIENLGVATTSFYRLATSPSGKPIEMLAMSHRVGNLNNLVLQVTAGGGQ